MHFGLLLTRDIFSTSRFQYGKELKYFFALILDKTLDKILELIGKCVSCALWESRYQTTDKEENIVGT